MERFETDAVLRVSFGNFLFFTILAIFMIGVKNQKDPRDNVHHGGWMMKIICWCILVILNFFVPNDIISFYDPTSWTLYVFHHSVPLEWSSEILDIHGSIYGKHYLIC